WTPEAQVAFEGLKTILTEAPILQNPDFSKKYYVHCDANDGLGAVLVQITDEGMEKPVAFMSCKLTTTQRNYSVTERECLAALEAIDRFRCYLELQEFEVITDHASLVWLMRQRDLKGRLARWAMKLQGYRFTVSHRRGKDNIVPDALSRFYSPSEEILALEEVRPEVDLNAPEFKDEAYQQWRTTIKENKPQYPNLKVEEELIYICIKSQNDGLEDRNQVWKLWIPKRMTDQVIQRAHDDINCAHGGMNKTLELIRR
ncbi:hypothetical protein KR084_010806, partial [Drosophila pseudotakahashii]